MIDEEQEIKNRKLELYKRGFNVLIWLFQVSSHHQKLRDMYGIKLGESVIEILEKREKMGGY